MCKQKKDSDGPKCEQERVKCWLNIYTVESVSLAVVTLHRTMWNIFYEAHQIVVNNAYVSDILRQAHSIWSNQPTHAMIND